jgi:hypothetical protein
MLFAAAHNGRYPQIVQVIHTIKTHFVTILFSIIPHLLLYPVCFQSNILHVHAFIVYRVVCMYIFQKYRPFQVHSQDSCDKPLIG